MTLTLDLLLHVLAFLCFLGAAAGAWSRVTLLAAGLAIWMLSLIV